MGTTKCMAAIVTLNCSLIDEVDQFDYNYNSSEWVEIAGLVTIPIPYSLLYLLTDGNIVVRFETLQYGKIGSIDAYSIDYSELIIDYED